MPEDNTGDDSTDGRSLRTITKGASLFFAGRITSNGLGFVFNLILTRVLGAALYGIYSYANMIIGILIIFSQLGTGKALLRFIPASSSDPVKQNWVTLLAYLTSLVGSVVIGATLFVISPTINELTLDEPLLTTVIRIMAIVLPFQTLTNVTYSLFRSLEKLEYQIIISNVLRPSIRIIAVLAAFLLGYSLIGTVAALAIGAILTFSAALSVLYLRTDIRPLGNRTRGSIGEFYNFSLPLTLNDIGAKLYNRVDILMVGLFLTSSEVGIYRISILLAAFLTLPLSGINQLFPPIASELYADKQVDELESVYKTVTRWVFTITLLPALILSVYSREILRVFGGSFTAGSLVLVLFSISQLTNSAVGPSGFLLMMTDNQYLTMLNQWTLGVLNVIFNYLFVLRFGFIGIAVATAGTLAFINVIRVFEVWYIERMTPFSKQYLKPITAGLSGGLILLGWRVFFEGYPLLIIGSVTGSLVFLISLVALGIAEEDREFYREEIRPHIK